LILHAAPAYPQAPLKDDYEALGRAVVAELSARQFGKILAQFDERVAAALPAEKLAAVWDNLLTQVGAFRSVKVAEQEAKAGLQLVYLTCAFERASLEFQVAFDAQLRIAALRFVPVGARAGWKPAAYVRPEAFQERAVTLTTGRWQLPGTLALPVGSGPFPAVVLVHGSGALDQDETVGANKPFKDLAGGLASHGIAVLRYTKRTFKYGPQSSDDPAALTVNEETLDDARAAVALLATMKEIHPQRIFVLGHSLGAMVGPRIAVGNKQVAGLILMAGNTRPIEELVIEQARYAAELDGKITPEKEKQIQAAEQSAREIRNPQLKPGMTVQFLGMATPAAYFLDLRNYRPGEAAATLGIPILVLQGERDYQVRFADFNGWKKALEKKPNASFKLYPGLNHLFMFGTGPSSPAEYLQPNHVQEEVVRDIGEWIAARTAAPAAAAPQPK